MRQTNWWMIASVILFIAVLAITVYRQRADVSENEIEITVPKIAGIYIPTNSSDSYAIAVFDLKDKSQLDVFNNLTIKFMELARDKV